ncbi:arylamine N-acetyltransferase [Salinifilum aidingensis]
MAQHRDASDGRKSSDGRDPAEGGESAEERGSADEWGSASVDVDAYLDRIGHPLVAPSVEALGSLHEAHVRTIPFENIDVVLERHPGIGLPAVAAKLVGRARGGYCYEHASLFAAVLERLGFGVRRCMARVQPHKSGPLTHMLLVVTVEGREHLADVGFGAGLLHPMPLRDGAVVDQAGWPHRLVEDGGVWTLQKWQERGWEPLHASDVRPSRPVDYEVAHHYTATHPNSPFTGKPVVMRLEEGELRRLVGDELIVERAGGGTDRETVPPERIGAVLRDLDVELTAEELDSLRAKL